MQKPRGGGPPSRIGFCDLRFAKHRVCLHFHQHLRRDQAAHLHHARRRPYRPEKFSVCPPDLFPFRDVRHINPRSHHIVQGSACLSHRRLNVPNRLHRLRVHISHANNLAVRPRSRSPRHAHHIPHPHRPRVPHNRLPRRPTRNILTSHAYLLRPARLRRCASAC
jgi:hypothetical protein